MLAAQITALVVFNCKAIMPAPCGIALQQGILRQNEWFEVTSATLQVFYNRIDGEIDFRSCIHFLQHGLPLRTPLKRQPKELTRAKSSMCFRHLNESRAVSVMKD
jgi:hypothetical protein